MANVSEGRWNQGVGTPVSPNDRPMRFDFSGRPLRRGVLDTTATSPRGTVLSGQRRTMPAVGMGARKEAATKHNRSLRESDIEMANRLAQLVAGINQIEEGSVEAGILGQALQRLFPGGLQSFMQAADQASQIESGITTRYPRATDRGPGPGGWPR